MAARVGSVTQYTDPELDDRMASCSWDSPFTMPLDLTGPEVPPLWQSSSSTHYSGSSIASDMRNWQSHEQSSILLHGNSKTLAPPASCSAGAEFASCVQGLQSHSGIDPSTSIDNPGPTASYAVPNLHPTISPFQASTSNPGDLTSASRRECLTPHVSVPDDFSFSSFDCLGRGESSSMSDHMSDFHNDVAVGDNLNLGPSGVDTAMAFGNTDPMVVSPAVYIDTSLPGPSVGHLNHDSITGDICPGDEYLDGWTDDDFLQFPSDLLDES